MKKLVYAIVSLIFSFILLFPYFFHQVNFNVQFNQHFIEGIYRENNIFTLKEKYQSHYSFYTLATNSLFQEQSLVSYEDPDSMFTYVFDHIPSYAIVYPSERYYYYTFPVNDRVISGNLRLVEVDNGKIGMGYFDKNDQSFSKHKLFGGEDGVLITKISDDTYRITFKEKTVTFKFFDYQSTPLEEFVIFPEEEHISQVVDESGVIFYLLFNNKTNSFYYVINEQRHLSENLVAIAPNILVGNRTDFAFFYDQETNRKVLFGVFQEHRNNNNYFDGPFDQVPPFLPLREKIYKAYPYTQYGQGIDEHGNFLDRESSRVSISPYLDYYNDNQIIKRVEECTNLEKGELYSCLAYENKKDYHKDSQLFYKNGTLRKVS